MQSAQFIRVFQSNRTRHLFLQCACSPLTDIHKVPSSACRQSQYTPCLDSTEWSVICAPRYKCYMNTLPMLKIPENWHSAYCVVTGYSIMMNLKLYKSATPDQAVVLFTAFCYLLLLWKLFSSFHYGSIFNSTAKICLLNVLCIHTHTHTHTYIYI